MSDVALPQSAAVFKATVELSSLFSAPPIARLADALGCEPITLDPPIAELVVVGAVARWDACPRGPAVILTAYAAASVGLTLADDGRRWVESGRVRGRLPRRSTDSDTKAETDLRDGPDDPWTLDSIPDPRTVPPPRSHQDPPPRKHGAGKAGRPLPVPTLLLGEGLIWPVPTAAKCPGCGGPDGRRLGPDHLCLICDRYGSDHMIDDLDHAAVRASKGARSTCRPDGRLAGGKGRVRRGA